MRWLGLLIASIGLVLSSVALAVPNADAEQAYARGDYETAFKIWFKLAEQGSVQAQLNVARMYERGEWVAQDSEAAREWYERASAQSAQDAAMPGMPRVANAVPGATPPANVPVAYPPPASYPRPAAYPPPVAYPSPSPGYVPASRPLFIPILRIHRHHH